jgi:hypothetical protein
VHFRQQHIFYYFKKHCSLQQRQCCTYVVVNAAVVGFVPVHFGKMYRQKSGNPALNQKKIFFHVQKIL